MPELNPQPSTAELHQQYGAGGLVHPQVEEKRSELIEAVSHPDKSFISIDGPCPLTINPQITYEEGDVKLANAMGLSGYIAMDRECFYKPRSNPNDWHGVDESHPVYAYQMLTSLAKKNANLAAEVNSVEHLRRYSHALSMIWLGSRTLNGTLENEGLIEDIATYEPNIVIGVKNGLDGNFGYALSIIDRINRVRGNKSAPAILIYRGGDNYNSEKTSLDQYKRAHDATGGKLFFDTAHGVEMAFNPTGKYKKSVAGQVLASRALVNLSAQGYAPLGKFSEASKIPSVIDPHMDLGLAMQDSRNIYYAKLGIPRPVEVGAQYR